MGPVTGPRAGPWHLDGDLRARRAQRRAVHGGSRVRWASVRRSSRGLSLRPFTQTNPGLSPSPCCPSSGQVFTPDWEEAAFHQGQDSALERGEKMSFDLFILTVPFFLRAPQIFSSGNCFTCLNRPACSPARIESNGIVFETAMQSPSRDICGTPVPDRGGSQRERSVSQDAGRDQEAQTTVTFTTCPPGAGRRRRGFRPL